MARTEVKSKILAEGEATGHHHRVTTPSATVWRNEWGNGTSRLEIDTLAEGAIVTHEEHKPIQLPPGNFIVGRVQEFDPFSQRSRVVRD